MAERNDIPRVQAETEAVLREVRRVGDGEEDDFTVRDMTQIANTMAMTSTLLTGLLGAVAAVSLLVGGIGIMNIMLVSVTERTREIGIRLAIGALERQVLSQFLVESIVLALFGGIIGIMIGLALAGAASILMDVPFAADIRVIALAFVVSARHRRGLRLLPGTARGAPRSDRGAPARMISPGAGDPGRDGSDRNPPAS